MSIQHSDLEQTTYHKVCADDSDNDLSEKSHIYE